MKAWKITYRFCVIAMLWAIALNVMPAREWVTKSIIEFILISVFFIFGILASLFSESTSENEVL